MTAVYAIRRHNILKSIGEALARLDVSSELTEEELDITCPFSSLKVKFHVKKRLFGAMIECYYQATFPASETLQVETTVWQGSWQRSKLVFNSRRQPLPASLKSVNTDAAAQRLVQEAGLKKVTICYRFDEESRRGYWDVIVYPLAGVIAVVYFPPVFPLAVSLQVEEVQKQYRCLERIVGVISEKAVS